MEAIYYLQVNKHTTFIFFIILINIQIIFILTNMFEIGICINILMKITFSDTKYL